MRVTPHTAPALQRAAVHDCRIQFIVPVEREHGSAAGVEQRIILEHHDGARHGVQAGAAPLQYRVARIERLGQARPIFQLSPGVHFGARQGTGAAMNG
jgi:hypothetical protein